MSIFPDFRPEQFVIPNPPPVDPGSSLIGSYAIVGPIAGHWLVNNYWGTLCEDRTYIAHTEETVFVGTTKESAEKWMANAGFLENATYGYRLTKEKPHPEG